MPEAVVDFDFSIHPWDKYDGERRRSEQIRLCFLILEGYEILEIEGISPARLKAMVRSVENASTLMFEPDYI